MKIFELDESVGTVIEYDYSYNKYTHIFLEFFHRNSHCLDMPEDIEEIAENAFASGESNGKGKLNLTKVKIPNKVQVIGKRAFYNCDLKTVVIPNSVTVIGAESFAGNKHLSKVKLGSQVKYIGDAVFKNTALEIIEIPNSVEEIHYDVFRNCNNLKKIVFKFEKQKSTVDLRQGEELVRFKKQNGKWYSLSVLDSKEFLIEIAPEGVTKREIINSHCLGLENALELIDTTISLKEATMKHPDWISKRKLISLGLPVNEQTLNNGKQGVLYDNKTMSQSDNLRKVIEKSH